MIITWRMKQAVSRRKAPFLEIYPQREGEHGEEITVLPGGWAK